MKRKYSRSKKLSWFLVIAACGLSIFAMQKGFDGAAISIWSVTVPSACALYANKQYQDRKMAENAELK